jgi:hypothetical protein
MSQVYGSRQVGKASRREEKESSDELLVAMLACVVAAHSDGDAISNLEVLYQSPSTVPHLKTHFNLESSVQSRMALSKAHNSLREGIRKFYCLFPQLRGFKRPVAPPDNVKDLEKQVIDSTPSEQAVREQWLEMAKVSSALIMY